MSGTIFKENWMLDDDLVEDDYLMDPISFHDIILALHCGCKNITPQEVEREFQRTLEMRLEDARFLLDKNKATIIKHAKEGRE